jgi:hypothetical protein
VQANPDPTKSGKKDDPIRVTFGKLMPKDKKDKKPPPKKKDEKPPKPILWEAEKGIPPSTTLDLVR